MPDSPSSGLGGCHMPCDGHAAQHTQTSHLPTQIKEDIHSPSLAVERCSSAKCEGRSSVTRFGSPTGDAAQTGHI